MHTENPFNYITMTIIRTRTIIIMTMDITRT